MYSSMKNHDYLYLYNIINNKNINKIIIDFLLILKLQQNYFIKVSIWIQHLTKLLLGLNACGT